MNLFTPRIHQPSQDVQRTGLMMIGAIVVTFDLAAIAAAILAFGGLAHG